MRNSLSQLVGFGYEKLLFEGFRPHLGLNLDRHPEVLDGSFLLVYLQPTSNLLMSRYKMVFIRLSIVISRNKQLK